MNRRRTKHHLIPKSREEEYGKGPALMLSWHHHQLWHELFHNMTLSEIIEALQRIQRMKESP